MNQLASPEYIREFADSLPVSYRDKYDASVIAAHARVSASRGAAPANVGLFGQRRGDAVGVCIVAGDQPGLLSVISAALVRCGLDVAAAEAYTRGSGKDAEAVDLFWLRRLGGASEAPVDDTDVAAVRSSLAELLGHPPSTRAAPELAAPRPPAASPSADALVRFVEGEEGGLSTLEVETSDRSGLLLVLSNALFQQRVQIVRSEVRTLEHRVFDRFTVVEFDGSPIDRARRLQIQIAVLEAIEPARRSSPPAA